MKIEEIEFILKQCLVKEETSFDFPSDEEWQLLEKHTNCLFCDDFKIFVNLMSKYMFPGDIFNVKQKNNNGNDMIQDVYDDECSYPEWNKDMIPFYGIGNGDYFCVNRNNPAIYYYYADKLKYELYTNSFCEWIKDLPNFLN